MRTFPLGHHIFLFYLPRNPDTEVNNNIRVLGYLWKQTKEQFDQIQFSVVYFNVGGNRNTLGETISGQSTGLTAIETDISRRQMTVWGRILVFL